MRIDVQVENSASPALRRLAQDGVPKARTTMVDQGLAAALQSIVPLNPLRTGRSRAAWAAALSQLGGGPALSAGMGGPIAEGAARGSLSRDDRDSTTDVRATNAVRYVPFLEYGTSKRAPLAMVRRSLAAVSRVIGRWFSLN